MFFQDIINLEIVITTKNCFNFRKKYNEILKRFVHVNDGVFLSLYCLDKTYDDVYIASTLHVVKEIKRAFFCLCVIPIVYYTICCENRQKRANEISVVFSLCGICSDLQ